MPSTDETAQPNINTQLLTIADQRERRLLPASAVLAGHVISWAKSYNLGWKWATGGGTHKSKKTTASKIKLQHTNAGFGVAILPTPDMQDVAFYVVSDYFSHSVSFARLKICRRRVRPGDEVQDCVVWEPDRSAFADSVESTLLFAAYHDACCVHKQRVPVESCFLAEDMCDRLFVSHGFLTVASLREKSLLMFEMTSSLMKGVQQPNKKKKKNEPDASPAAAASADSAGQAEPDDAADAADLAYMAGNGEGETDDLCDIRSDHSGCEHDEAENVAAMRELKEDAAVATAQTTRELKHAMSSRQSAPSARQVTRATRAIAESGCASPTAEMQEEALLLLIRQRKQDRSKQPRQLRLEGVGEATCQDVDSDSAASDNSAEVVPNDRNSWVVQNFAGTSDEADSSHIIYTLALWADACITVLEALREVHDLQECKSLGQDRSISLVLMHPTRIDECQCVRCKWHLAHAGDLPEVIWVSWLNNSPTYGVTGRRA